jgi:hypothetical protein
MSSVLGLANPVKGDVTASGRSRTTCLTETIMRNEADGFAALAVSIGVMSNALGGSIESHIVA